MSKFGWAGFLIFVLVFMYVTLDLAEISVPKSQPSFLYRANFYFDFEITEYPS